MCLKNAQGEAHWDTKLWWDLKTHAIHNSQLEQGGQSLSRATTPAQASMSRFDDVPPPAPDGDWHSDHGSAEPTSRKRRGR